MRRTITNKQASHPTGCDDRVSSRIGRSCVLRTRRATRPRVCSAPYWSIQLLYSFARRRAYQLRQQHIVSHQPYSRWLYSYGQMLPQSRPRNQPLCNCRTPTSLSSSGHGRTRSLTVYCFMSTGPGTLRIYSSRQRRSSASCTLETRESNYLRKRHKLHCSLA